MNRDWIFCPPGPDPHIYPLDPNPEITINIDSPAGVPESAPMLNYIKSYLGRDSIHHGVPEYMRDR